MSETTVEQKSTPYRKTKLALLIGFAIYAALLVAGIPQKWTRAQFSHHNEPSEVAAVENGAETEIGSSAEAEADEGAELEAPVHYPPIWTSIPFAALLLCIAILPLIPATEHWWESNKNRFLVAALGIGPATASQRYVRALERLQQKLMELSCFKKNP